MQPKPGGLGLGPDAIESAKVDGAGGGWLTAPGAILDTSAVTLALRVRGGEGQREGVLGVADFVRRFFPTR